MKRKGARKEDGSERDKEIHEDEMRRRGKRMMSRRVDEKWVNSTYGWS